MRDVRSILALHPGAVGDVLCARPALAALHARFPAAEITLATPSPVAELFEPDMRRIAWDAVPLHTVYAGEAGARAHAEWLTPHDLIVSWTGAGDYGFCATLTALCEADGCGCFIAAPIPPEGSTLHVTDYLMNTLALLARSTGTHRVGAPNTPVDAWPALHVPVLPAAYASWVQTKRADGRRLALLHPGSGSTRKNWPLAHFHALAEMMRSDGWTVAVLLGPAEDAMTGFAEGVLVVRHEPITVVAAFCAEADVFVGNDSGITHLAAHLGAPTLALFGPTDSRVWRPRGPCVHVVASPTGKMCDISPEAAFSEVQALGAPGVYSQSCASASRTSGVRTVRC